MGIAPVQQPHTATNTPTTMELHHCHSSRDATMVTSDHPGRVPTPPSAPSRRVPILPATIPAGTHPPVQAVHPPTRSPSVSNSNPCLIAEGAQWGLHGSACLIATIRQQTGGWGLQSP